MSGEGFRAFAFFALLALVGGVLFALAPKLWGEVGDVEGELITWLKKQEKDGVAVELSPGARLRSSELHYARLSVEVDAAKRRAVVRGTLDFSGKLGEVQVSSLGLEQVVFHYRDGRWDAPSPAPRLAAILQALRAREDALAKGDLGALRALSAAPDAGLAWAESILSLRDRNYRAKAWFIRSEREDVTVTEEYRVAGDTPERPIDEQGVKRLRLVKRSDEFLFEEGLR